MDAVINLRKSRCASVPPCKGVYRWWFKVDAVSAWLTSLSNADKSRILTQKINGCDYLALYVGISKDLQDRLRWHICQKHSSSAVKSGYLSTLRHTISALLGKKASESEGDVNTFMDANCYVEWWCVEEPGEMETKLLSSSNPDCYPLNVAKNKTVDTVFIKEVKRLRKENKN